MNDEPQGIPKDTPELQASFEKEVLDQKVPTQAKAFRNLIPHAPGKPTGISSVEVIADKLSGRQLQLAQRFIKKAKRSDHKRKQEKRSRKANRRRK